MTPFKKVSSLFFELLSLTFRIFGKNSEMHDSLSTPFNNAQLELLKLFSTELSGKDLEDLKRILLRFKFERVTEMADKIWEEKGWTNEDVEKMLHTHTRTPYKSQEKYLKNKAKKS
jgi:hypothetical protein